MKMRSALVTVALLAATTLSAQPTRSLPRSTPEREGVSSAGIEAFVRAADTLIDAMHSVMIVRHGRVVAEGWWTPYDAATPHSLFSLSKGFTSTAVGLAVAEGKLSLDDPVLKYFPDEAPAQPSENLRAMRVRDLLRMNIGHQTEPNPRTPDSTQRDASWVRRILAHPVPYKPGTHFLYNSWATYLQSAIVQKVTGQTVLEYLGPRIFEPLDIAKPTWTASPQGITVGAYGLSVRTEDIAKFGQLYLQKGEWQGRRLVPAAWVEAATAVQTANGSNPRSDWDQGYGYQFWRSRHGYRADGALGQSMLVLPEHDLVIAMTGGVSEMQPVLDLVWEKLLPAVSPSALPENPAARRALQGTLARLSLRLPAGRPSSPVGAAISKRWYDVSDNALGILKLSFDITSPAPALIVRTKDGDARTSFGVGSWVRSKAGPSAGIERVLNVTENAPIAASGAWTADSVFTLKLVAAETPFSATLAFRFDGDRLSIDAPANVGMNRAPRRTFEARLAPGS